jgi:hypothetical protein
VCNGKKGLNVKWSMNEKHKNEEGMSIFDGLLPSMIMLARSS